MRTLKLIIVITLASISTSLFGQDIIVTKNGKEIESKVAEVGSSIIKYKMHNNLDGPIYTIDKSELVFIKYENGEKDVFTSAKQIDTKNKELSIGGNGFKPKYYEGNTPISKEKFKELFSSNERAYDSYKTGKALYWTGVSTAIVLPAISLAGYSAGGLDKKEMNITAFGGLIAGGIIMTTGLIQKFNGLKNYNKDLKVAYNVSLNSQGIGLAINF